MGKMKQIAQMLEDIEHIETERDMYKEECEKLKLELELQKKLYEDIRLDRDALNEDLREKTMLCLQLFMKGDKWDLPWFLDTFGSKSDA